MLARDFSLQQQPTVPSLTCTSPALFLFPEAVIGKLGSSLLVNNCSLVQIQESLIKLRIVSRNILSLPASMGNFHYESSFGKAGEIVLVLKYLAELGSRGR